MPQSPPPPARMRRYAPATTAAKLHLPVEAPASPGPRFASKCRCWKESFLSKTGESRDAATRAPPGASPKARAEAEWLQFLRRPSFADVNPTPTGFGCAKWVAAQRAAA